MPIRYIVSKLSRTQRDFLIDHIDGTRPIGHFQNEDTTRNALLTRELIRYDQPPEIVGRPRGTLLTDKGREAVGHILGEYADALVRWGYIRDSGSERALPQDMPMVAMTLLERIKDG